MTTWQELVAEQKSEDSIGLAGQEAIHIVFIGQSGSGHDLILDELSEEKSTDFQKLSGTSTTTVSAPVIIRSIPGLSSVVLWAVSVDPTHPTVDIPAVIGKPAVVFGVVNAARPWSVQEALIKLGPTLDLARVSTDDAPSTWAGASGSKEAFVLVTGGDRLAALKTAQFSIPTEYEAMLSSCDAETFAEINDMVVHSIRSFCIERGVGMVAHGPTVRPIIEAAVSGVFKRPQINVRGAEALFCPPGLDKRTALADMTAKLGSLATAKIPAPSVSKVVAGQESRVRSEEQFAKDLASQLGPASAAAKTGSETTSPKPAMKGGKSKKLEQFWTSLSKGK
ncbi:hypothetical protein J8273_4693 [Carpediemonas membranifera]|uniref:Uncharacterized protein n=1 Tax=Carpediemonas membranifera TaxID=201153 RepID=A0A8J6AVX2_9EUKA|nr:hypothetical protein J8273_4693 [Carpediemonas membranifera]|eukprot:KAG9393830.1 hypothetical protein J8273_4693 [Carpediemonas membranifera]